MLRAHCLPAQSISMTWLCSPHVSQASRCISLLGLSQQSTTDWVFYHKRKLLSHSMEARSQKSRCGQDWFLRRAVREGPVPGLCPSFWWPPEFLALQMMSFLCLYIIFCSLLVCLEVHMSPFYKDPNQIEFGSTLMTSSNLSTLLKTPSPNKVTFWSTRG